MNARWLLALFALVLGGCFKEESFIQGEVDATTIQISAKIPARIDNIFIHRGDKVSAQQVIARLSTPELEAKLEQAKATQEMAKAQEDKALSGARPEEISQSYNMYKSAQSKAQIAAKTADRLESLYAQGVVSLQKKDEARAAALGALHQAKMAKNAYEMASTGARREDKESAKAALLKANAGLKEVEAYLDEAQVKSPINGEISNIIAQRGEIVPAGFPIASVTDLSDVWVVFSVREDLLPRFTMGKVFKARFPGLQNRTVELRVSFVAVLGSYATYKATNAKGGFDLKSFEIHARPVHPLDGLRPGMSALVVD